MSVNGVFCRTGCAACRGRAVGLQGQIFLPHRTIRAVLDSPHLCPEVPGIQKVCSSHRSL